MLIDSRVSLPLQTKDPCEAVNQSLDYLRSKTSSTNNVKISLGLVSMSYPDILVLLAKALPEQAEGFGMDGSVSAGQFLRNPRSGQFPKSAVCSCDITDYLSVTESLSLIESFFRMPPRAVRSTSFSITLENLHWNGSNGIGSGALHLFDFKGFNRKHRFQLMATYSCRGENSKDPTVKNLLKTITDESGIPFKKGSITEQIEQESLTRSRLDQILVARICFEEAFESTGLQVRKCEFQLEKLPGLASQDESFNRRMKDFQSGKKERVNFLSLVRRFIKEFFPEFKPFTNIGEQIFFSKQIYPGLELVLGFDRIHFQGLGKTFTLLLGINIAQGQCAGCTWDDNLFRLFNQRRFPPYWTYVTKAELTQILDGIRDFLQEILHVFEKELNRCLCPIPTIVPDFIPNRGPITAKIALEESLNTAKMWSDDAALFNMGSGGLLYLRDRGMGPMIDIHGAIRPHGFWYCCFYSQSKKRTLFTQVPSIGSLRYDEWSLRHSFGSAGESVFPTPTDKWLDSNQAMAIAEDNGGRAARESAVNNWDIILKLEVPPNRAAGARIALQEYEDKLSQAASNYLTSLFENETSKNQSFGLRWTVHYLIQKTKNRREDFIISFNAVDGTDIEITHT